MRAGMLYDAYAFAHGFPTLPQAGGAAERALRMPKHRPAGYDAEIDRSQCFVKRLQRTRPLAARRHLYTGSNPLFANFLVVTY